MLIRITIWDVPTSYTIILCTDLRLMFFRLFMRCVCVWLLCYRDKPKLLGEWLSLWPSLSASVLPTNQPPHQRQQVLIQCEPGPALGRHWSSFGCRGVGLVLVPSRSLLRSATPHPLHRRVCVCVCVFVKGLLHVVAAPFVAFICVVGCWFFRQLCRVLLIGPPECFFWTPPVLKFMVAL